MLHDYKDIKLCFFYVLPKNMGKYAWSCLSQSWSCSRTNLILAATLEALMLSSDAPPSDGTQKSMTETTNTPLADEIQHKEDFLPEKSEPDHIFDTPGLAPLEVHDQFGVYKTSGSELLQTD